MTIIRCASILLVCIVIGFRVTAQKPVYSFSGKIVDGKGAGLAGAAVSIRKGRQGTVTNEQGEFVLNGIPAGKCKVNFVYIGCRTKDTVILFGGPVNNLVICLCISAKQKDLELNFPTTSQVQKSVGRNEE